MDTKQKNREAAPKARPGKEGTRSQAPRREKTKARPAEVPQSRNKTRQAAPAEKGRTAPAAKRPNPRGAEKPARSTGIPGAARRETQGAAPTVHQGGPHQRSAQAVGVKHKPLPKAEPRKRSEREREEKKNALQNFIAGVRGTPDQQEKRAEQARLRREKRAAEAERKRRQAERSDAPAVIYTEPQTFNRNRLLLQLLSITAVVAALVVGMSVFFKVGKIHVAGADFYSNWNVVEASGIKEGDNLLTFSRARASAQIRAELPYVSKVRIGIKLPETVTIYIEEMDVSYAIKSTDGDWWLITSGGRVTEQITEAEAGNHTQVLGVTLESPAKNEDAVAMEQVPTETTAEGELIPIPVTGSQRLYAALQILKALEANDIVGEAASVNVSRLEDVILWYGTRYQVNLGDTSRMEYKIACMNDAILQLSEYQSGILDLSFTIWPDQVGYTPFG